MQEASSWCYFAFEVVAVRLARGRSELPVGSEPEPVSIVRPQNRYTSDVQLPRNAVRSIDVRNDEAIRSVQENRQVRPIDMPLGFGGAMNSIELHCSDTSVMNRCRCHDLPQGVGVLAVDGVEPTKPEVTQQVFDFGQPLFRGGGDGGRFRRGRRGDVDGVVVVVGSADECGRRWKIEGESPCTDNTISVSARTATTPTPATNRHRLNCIPSWIGREGYRAPSPSTPSKLYRRSVLR